MLNRRLLFLFIAFVLGFSALAVRLWRLQVVDAAYWQGEMRAFVHRHQVIDSYRGAILDRNGEVLARDVPSDELAIDYRAMNLDDAWLTRTAVERLKAAGEWNGFADRAARSRRIDEVKRQLAGQIDAIPDGLATVLADADHVSREVLREQILQRFQDIRARIHALRQDILSRRFDREAVRANVTDSTDDDAALDALLRQTQLKDEVVAHTIRAKISPAARDYFKQHLADYPGLIVRDMTNRRDYPFGEALAQVVGTLMPVDENRVKEHRFDMPNLLAENDPGDLTGYLPGDRMGETGAERGLEDQLRGTRGVRLIDLTESGAEAAEESRHIDPAPGKDVRLTIDAELQADLYKALQDPAKHLLRGTDGKDHFVAMVVMSMDGQILSLVSYPSYDPNTIDDNRATLNRDTYRLPRVNRAVNGVYQPGSTVKPLLAVAGLAERVITPEESILCIGHFYPNRPDAFRCDLLSGHGEIRLVDAISESCNVYFFNVAHRLGVARLERWYDAYGFGQRTGLELGGETGSILNAAQITEPDTAEREALFVGIGQGKIAVTPLQLADAYATLLRGGLAVNPRLFADTSVQQTQRFTISSATLATVRRGMELCTTSGTAKTNFRNFRLPVAGKTGTAEKERGVYDDQGIPVDDPGKPLTDANRLPKVKPDGTQAYKQMVERHTDAWFAGYAPADKPQFIVVTLMEWGGFGSAAAAPMAREAFEQLERHGYLPRVDVPG